MYRWVLIGGFWTRTLLLRLCKGVRGKIVFYQRLRLINDMHTAVYRWNQL